MNCVFIRLFCVSRHLRAPGLHILWRLALPVVRFIASTKLRLLLILSCDTYLSNAWSAPWSATPCAVWGFYAASFFWGPKDSFVSAFTAGLLWAVGLFLVVNTELYSSLYFFVDFACQKVLTLLPKNDYDLMPSIFILLSLLVLCYHSCLFILFNYLAFFYLFKLYVWWKIPQIFILKRSWDFKKEV